MSPLNDYLGRLSRREMLTILGATGAAVAAGCGGTEGKHGGVWILP